MWVSVLVFFSSLLLHSCLSSTVSRTKMGAESTSPESSEITTPRPTCKKGGYKNTPFKIIMSTVLDMNTLIRWCCVDKLCHKIQLFCSLYLGFRCKPSELANSLLSFRKILLCRFSSVIITLSCVVYNYSKPFLLK